MNERTTELIGLAQKDPKFLGPLLEHIRPLLRAIASKIASQIVDDAVAVAEVRIWKKLPKIDMSRPDTAKAYLIRTGVSGMRDELRKYLRATKRYRGPVEELNISQLIAPSANEENRAPPAFDGIFKLYINHIEATGDFAGAHAAVAAKLGVTTARATTLFHKASQEFTSKLLAEDEDATHAAAQYARATSSRNQHEGH